MPERTSRYEEIVVRVIPSPTETSRRPSEEVRRYDALIYARLAIPGLIANPQPSGQPREMGELPLVASERIDLRWREYQQYLASFDLGEKEERHMRQRLVEAMTAGLQILFGETPLADRPVRLWWSLEAPELEDLPWELLASTGRTTDRDFSFVRGVPPKVPPPLVPVDGPLRLGLIGHPEHTPESLLRLLTLRGIPGIEIIPLSGQPLQAVQTAVREGYELLHIVADGEVLLSYEGVLYFHGQDEPRLSSGELSNALFGSRVTLLCLTANEYRNSDMVEIGDALVPSVYRAFAQLASEDLPLPSIVAPLGPLNPLRLERFWLEFYTEFAETHRVEKAMSQGREGGPVPMSLFLRHPQGVLFRRSVATRSSSQMEPTHIQVELQVSRSLIGKLNSLAAQYGKLSESADKFLKSQDSRNKALDEELSDWRWPEESDR